MPERKTNMVVVGAGVGGVKAAMDLAEIGYKILLLDRAPVMGGVLNRLDHQFPNNHCGFCRLLPMLDRDAGSQFCLKKGFIHENIEFLGLTNVVSVDGSPGQMTVVLETTPSGIDQSLCIGCNACLQACPVETPCDFNAGLETGKAIHRSAPHHIDGPLMIDWQACTKCGACVKVCPTGAVDLSADAVVREEVQTGAVILATGLKYYDPSQTDVYGFGKMPNVVTAEGFERIMSGSGPYEGRLIRPSDGRPAKKIGWVQCVGSRNIMIGANYCSSVCCMFAVKEAILAREKFGPGVEVSIFYMDMRTFGRDFQRYRDQAEKEHGVKFVRCRVHSIESGEEPGDLKIRYVDEQGELQEELLDIAVLSTGQDPKNSLPDFADQEGVFVLDSARSLTDIDGAVAAAGEAAAGAAGVVDVPGKEPPARISSLTAKRPMTLIALWARSDKAWAGLDVNSVAEARYGERTTTLVLPNEGEQPPITDLINKLKELNANRLILVSPNLKGGPVNKLAAELGLPASYIQIIDPSTALGPGGVNGLIRTLEASAVKLAARRMVAAKPRPTTPSALIVGSGPAGMSAALALAQKGVRVHLAEKRDCIGGNLPHIISPQKREKVEGLAAEVKTNPLITTYLETEPVRCLGSPGAFQVELKGPGEKKQTIKSGAVILAPGGGPHTADSYGLGENDKIISLFDLPEKSPGDLKNVVFIQCAGTREEPRNYCSRICCQGALEQALKILETQPQADVSIFYRDIMTYGPSESLYTEARKKGAYFIPYDPSNKPSVVIEDGRPVVIGFDPLLREEVRLTPDLTVLSMGLIPNPNEDLIKVFGLEATRDGFLKEADYKWRPVDSSREGIYICGLGRAPMKADEAVREGRAAAVRAFRILARENLPVPSTTARVRPGLCSLCLACLEVCPYNARTFDYVKRIIEVDPAACQGCGACAAACPNSAAMVGNFEEGGLMAAIEAML